MMEPYEPGSVVVKLPRGAWTVVSRSVVSDQFNYVLTRDVGDGYPEYETETATHAELLPWRGAEQERRRIYGAASARLYDLAQLVSKVERLAPDIQCAADLIASSINAGGKVLVCGNGGSAAQAQHFAAELVGRYRKERRALPAIALTTDTSAITAIGNDYGFDQVFSRQVLALGHEGDVLVALTTSGASPNVREAAVAMHATGGSVIVITGDGPECARWSETIAFTPYAEVHVRIPSDDTALIQELTQHVAHTIAEIVEERCG